ncbi:MAG: GYD domain-containing protein [Gammaproteobacteria bacterium]|nr:GYD domain-containing protein [Gammaproteobacteria bacterium]NIR83808.1 GYD domain-containing protein [Gammaproteobacteria bacterium]NIR88225.1 GYD domain-containing protein [Gammaproteobacteria bacterium]NIU05134.1 GYD domain-containing protein [Gammaproteobacteria bacterium]NIV51971.1 GYD domain-containing protein [Gammaproteobacteria bacterium]
MSTFFMFGDYSQESLKGISANRTEQATDVIKKLGGTVHSIHALLGEHDLVLIVDLPDVGKAVQASIALSKLTGISFNTSPALAVQEFDKIATSA